MKNHPPVLSFRRALTLLELVAVIAMIAILLLLLFPFRLSPRPSSLRSRASSTVRSIVHACENYANDYGKYPEIPDALVGAAPGEKRGGAYYSFGDRPDGKCKVNNDQLFDVLRANARGPNVDHKLNLRQQRYFEDGKASDRKNPHGGFADGEDFSDDIQGQFIDPWGKQYCVILDADGDRELKMNEFFKDQTEAIRQSAAVFSMGEDNRVGGKGYEGRLQKERSNEAPNDIVSWQ
jgi:type II secretory pathway pseudopilin PulG